MTALTRRDLLRTFVAGGVAALGCGDRPRFGGYAMSLQTWTFRMFDVDEALDMVQMLGLTHVELGSNHFNSQATPAQIAEMRDKLDARGLTCFTAGTEPFTADHDDNRRVFEFAAALGLRTILADPPPDSFDSLDRLVAEYDIRVGIHNHGPGFRYVTPDDVLRSVDGRDRRIGAVVDTGHFLRAGVDPAAALIALTGRVFGLHLKDVRGAGADAPDVVVGDGDLDLERLLAAMADSQLTHETLVSLEHEANPDDPYDDVAKALARIDRAARSRPQ